MLVIIKFIFSRLIPLGNNYVEPSIIPSPIPNSVQEEINYIKTEITNIIDRQNRIEQSFNSISKDSDNYQIYLELLELQGDLEKMSSELDNFGKIVLDNPEKALSTVLLYNELENIKSNYENDLINVRADMERVYRQNNWFIGLMFTIAIGLFTLSLRVINLNKGKGDNQEK